MMDALRPYLPYAHVLGAIVVTALLAAVRWGVVWVREKFREGFHVEPGVAVELGVSPTELRTDEDKKKVARYLMERYSSDQFKNRLSDLVGIALVVWHTLWMLIQAVFVIWVGWRIYEGDTDPVFMWGLPILWLVDVGVGLLVMACCWLITGRLPGAAGMKRMKATELFLEISSDVPK